MTLLTFVTWNVVALGTACGAGAVLKYGGHGLKADVLLAIVGSGSVCGIAWSLDILPDPGVAATAIAAFAGAGALIALQRRFF